MMTERNIRLLQQDLHDNYNQEQLRILARFYKLATNINIKQIVALIADENLRRVLFIGEMPDTALEEKLRELILNCSNDVDLYRAPRIAIEEIYKQPCQENRCDRELKVAVVVITSGGFGDIIFGTKFARYIKYGLTPSSKPYSHNVTILTGEPSKFKKLMVDDIDIIRLFSKDKDVDYEVSDLLPNLVSKGELPQFDLIFIAPHTMENPGINYSAVENLFKNSTPFNIIFLSEYQDKLDKGFDFNTGIGEDYDGLLFNDAEIAPKLEKIGPIPYALAYVAYTPYSFCFADFLKMIVTKYHNKYKNLQVVVPEHAVYTLVQQRTRFSTNSKELQKYIRQYYPNIVIKMKKGQTIITKGNGGKLIIRGDILPVSHPEMLSLIKYSIPDILITGDQSITDVLDCCQEKNIWYQTMDWKMDLAKALAKELPQKYLADKATTCGSLEAVRWNNTGTDFKQNHDFRKKPSIS